MPLGEKPTVGRARSNASQLSRRGFVASALAAPFLARSAQAADALNAYSDRLDKATAVLQGA